MPFFTFSQNNSGGHWQESEDLSHHVIIEAMSASEADDKLEAIGGYFDGCESGMDCECCGDRWYRQWNHSKVTTEPEVYGRHPRDYVTSKKLFAWTKPGKEVVIHYLDGRKEWF